MENQKNRCDICGDIPRADFYVKISATMFFPRGEYGMIIEPPIRITNEKYADFLKRQMEYESIETRFKAENHLFTDKYMSCEVGNYVLIFYKNGDIVVDCNFKRSEIVRSLDDLRAYGVELTPSQTPDQ